jgi:hypothetical protein
MNSRLTAWNRGFLKDGIVVALDKIGSSRLIGAGKNQFFEEETDPV